MRTSWLVPLVALSLVACTTHTKETTTPNNPSKADEPAIGGGLERISFPQERIVLSLMEIPEIRGEDEYTIALELLQFHKMFPGNTSAAAPSMARLRKSAEAWVARRISDFLDHDNARKASEYWLRYVRMAGLPSTDALRHVSVRLENALRSQGMALEYLTMKWFRHDRDLAQEIGRILVWEYVTRLVQERPMDMASYLRSMMESGSSQGLKKYMAVVRRIVDEVPFDGLWPLVDRFLGARMARLEKDIRAAARSGATREERRNGEAAREALSFLKEERRVLGAYLLYVYGGRQAALSFLGSGDQDLLYRLFAESDSSPEKAISLVQYYEKRVGRGSASMLVRKLASRFGSDPLFTLERVRLMPNASLNYARRYILLETLREKSARPVLKELLDETNEAISSLLGMEKYSLVKREIAFASKALSWTDARWPNTEFPLTHAQVCLARYNLWLLQGNDTNARKALENCPKGRNSEDLLDAMATFEFWQGHYRESLSYAERLENKGPVGMLMALALSPYRIEALKRLGMTSKAAMLKALLLKKINGLLSIFVQGKNRRMSKYLLLQLLGIDFGDKMDAMIFGIYQKFMNTEQDPSCSDYMVALRSVLRRGKLNWARDVFNTMVSKRVCSATRMWYSSLWIYLIGLAQGVDESEVALARDVLEGQPPSPWLEHLRNIAMGRETAEQAASHGTIPGHRCEAYFYYALRLLADGKYDRAREYLKKVLDTKIYNYHEFELSFWMLGYWDQFVPAGTNQDSGR